MERHGARAGDGVDDPIAHDWTWADDGTPNPARYYTNETVNGTPYDSWVFDSVAGDKGTYQDYYSDQSNALHAAGWIYRDVDWYVSGTLSITNNSEWTPISFNPDYRLPHEFRYLESGQGPF